MKRFLILACLLVPLFSSAQVLGTLESPLSARDAYAGSSPYMAFYHSLSLSQEGVDVSLCAPLSIKGTIPAGEVTEDQVKKLYPFPNSLVVLRMSGEEIQKYLEKSYDGWICTVSGPEDPVLRMKCSASGKWNFAVSPAHFDSAGGLDYTVDITRPYGERVRIAGLSDGRSFCCCQVYNVAITNYRAHGVGGLLQAAGIDPADMEDRIILKDKPFRDILREMLRKRGTIDPASLQVGSWHFVPDSLAAPGLARDLEKVLLP